MKVGGFLGSNEYDVVILDEINVALEYRLIELKDVLELIDEKQTISN